MQDRSSPLASERDNNLWTGQRELQLGEVTSLSFTHNSKLRSKENDQQLPCTVLRAIHSPSPDFNLETAQEVGATAVPISQIQGNHHSTVT
jgi:hypothetical protein